jgi:hypothetical protein
MKTKSPFHTLATPLVLLMLAFLCEPLLAYYCPSGGRFLNRDPIESLVFP